MKNLKAAVITLLVLTVLVALFTVAVHFPIAVFNGLLIGAASVVVCITFDFVKSKL
jgi:membrane-associated phospholipid phosphatase